MSLPALSFTETYELEACANCGIQFAMPVVFIQKRRQDHGSFYCPNGHSLVYRGKSEVERERERRIAAEAKAAQWEDRHDVAERRRRAEKGQRTRVLNRIHNGVCPHCGRTFDNLARHMATKHPQEQPS